MNDFGAHGLPAARFIQQNRDGRFQRMRQIADMGPRPLDDFLIVRNQRIEFFGQGRDFIGIVCRQPVLFALADFRH